MVRIIDNRVCSRDKSGYYDRQNAFLLILIIRQVAENFRPSQEKQYGIIIVDGADSIKLVAKSF